MMVVQRMDGTNNDRDTDVSILYRYKSVLEGRGFAFMFRLNVAEIAPRGAVG